MNLAPARLVLAVLCLTGCAPFAYSKDYGVQGQTWPIIEVNMTQLLVESASEVNWNKINAKLAKSGKHYVGHLPPHDLPGVSTTQTVWFDPAITLSADIKIPVKQPDGRYAWMVMYKKGTRVNPLKVEHPVTAMLFFNGKDTGQAKFAAALYAAHPARIVLVEAGQGGITASAKKTGTAVFYASAQLLGRFKIQKLPTLMYPGQGVHSLRLGETTFAPPFGLAQATQAWGALSTATPLSKGKRQ